MKDMLARLEKGKQVAQPPQEPSGLSVSDLRAELHAFATTISRQAITSHLREIRCFELIRERRRLFDFPLFVS